MKNIGSAGAAIAAALVTFGILGSGPATAGTIYVGLQEASVKGDGGVLGAIKTVVNGVTGSGGVSGMSFGSFSSNSINVQDETALSAPDVLFSNSIDTSASKAGTLTVWVTATGLTTPKGFSTFSDLFETAKLDNSNLTITEETWINAATTPFSTTGTALGPVTFTGPNPLVQSKTVTAQLDAGSPFSVTQEYRIVSTGKGSANSQNDLTGINTPEPATVAMLGTGLLGLGLIRRRRGA